MKSFLVALSLSLLTTAQGLAVETQHATKGVSKTSGKAGEAAHSINWQPWTDRLFEDAKRDKKLVILDLEAVWCHWCHVMEEKTYSNPDVAGLLGSKYIAVRVDQDSRPDLSNKYEDYGWPATIIFNADGQELVKRAGFIGPDDMLEILQESVRNPTPGPSVAAAPTIKYASVSVLPEALRNELTNKHVQGYDTKYGSWSTFQKFLDADSVEFALNRAKLGDAQSAKMARTTLDQQMHLLDPVWGGMYQYSTDGDWLHPHFEKIMQVQSDNMRVYSQGYSLFKDEKHLQAAKSIFNYMTKFLLSPDGAFYTSQDADIVKGKHSDWYFKLDDVHRRKYGVPRIDKHIYARENGWAIAGAVALYKATGDKQFLNAAMKAANWIATNRAIAGGGFNHDQTDAAGPYLGDTLYMGRAFLSLYEATGDRQWLKRATEAGDFVAAHFVQNNAPGLLTAESKVTSGPKPDPLLDENIAAARFFNLLSKYSGKPDYKKIAENSMRYLATPEIARKRRILVAGILLADRELTSEPIHITVLGSKSDPDAQVLLSAALKYPFGYKQIEWFDRKEGPLPNAEVEFPELPKAAAFGCAFDRCSAPIYKADLLTKTIDSFAKK